LKHTQPGTAASRRFAARGQMRRQAAAAVRSAAVPAHRDSFLPTSRPDLSKRRTVLLPWVAYAALSVGAWLASAADARPLLRDCRRCPELVAIPAGSVDIGADTAETDRERVPANYALRERPRHRVTISRSFALGRREVTRGEFRRFLRRSGYRPAAGCAIWNLPAWKFGDRADAGWENPGFRQRDAHPVVCVSFEDATAYVRWLTDETGKPYRLPTEAEWEYAARAGTATARYWGDGPDGACRYANSFDRTAASRLRDPGLAADDYLDCADGFAFTAPVGEFRANAFGLFDMLGNASEWVQDCAADDYDAAPLDGSADLSGDCSLRVTRGGSWSGKPWLLRAAERGRARATGRNSPLGFRVARDL
jgi:formylglycine-generating enzyme required for sulfatase activity